MLQFIKQPIFLVWTDYMLQFFKQPIYIWFGQITYYSLSNNLYMFGLDRLHILQFIKRPLDRCLVRTDYMLQFIKRPIDVRLGHIACCSLFNNLFIFG